MASYAEPRPFKSGPIRILPHRCLIHCYLQKDARTPRKLCIATYSVAIPCPNMSRLAVTARDRADEAFAPSMERSSAAPTRRSGHRLDGASVGGTALGGVVSRPVIATSQACTRTLPAKR